MKHEMGENDAGDELFCGPCEESAGENIDAEVEIEIGIFVFHFIFARVDQATTMK